MNNNQPQQQYYQEDTIDIKKLIMRLLSNWYWFILCIILCLGTAFMYNRYTARIYEVNTSMLVDAGNAGSPLGGGAGDADLFGGFGLMSSNLRDFYNQVVILGSTPIIEKTLDALDFEVSYFNVGRVMKSESYKDVPFRVEIDKSFPQAVDTEFNFHIFAGGKISIQVEQENISVYDYLERKIVKRDSLLVWSAEAVAGERLETENFAFTIFLKDKINPNAENNYSFRMNTQESLLRKYKGSLQIAANSKDNSILDITLTDTHVQKAMDFLNKLTEVYQIDNLGKKNEKANRTISFINTQLETISDSLEESEDQMQTFQTQNQVVDISLQSQQLLEQINELDKEQVLLETQNKYYKYLNTYIQTNQELETVIAPSAMGIEDPLLNSLILQLNQLIIEKSSMTSINNTEHPKIKRINATIESTKNSLLENTKNIISQSDIALADVKTRARRFESMVRQLPATERNYVNIERRYQLNNETYTFLLQKLAEAQIAKASNVPDSQIIEEAKIKGFGPISPKINIIYAIGLLMGLALPAVFIFLGDFFNNKIRSKEEIESLTKYPIIGQVYFNTKDKKSPTPILDKPNSPFGEPYSAIASKLNLLTKGKENTIIAVTSAFPEEGKSYNAMNIASSFALKKKKTVLLDLDFRNSKIQENLELESDLGVVNYIIGKAGIDEITFKTKHPFLKIIPAGPIPPNPIEMLNDEKLGELLLELKKTYDVIVLDTTPIGFVADLFQMVNIIDAYIFIVRHNQTHKQGLKTALEEIKNQQLKGVGIVVNAIKQKRKYGGYGYGYSYGYGYGYGYGQDKKGKKGKKNKKGRKKLEIMV